MMTGRELLHLQKVGLHKTDDEMAALMQVPVALYLAWVDPDDDCNPPVNMVLKIAKLVPGNAHSSVIECDKVKQKASLYKQGEVLEALLLQDLDDCDDADVPLQSEKLSILQRLMSGLLKL